MNDTSNDTGDLETLLLGARRNLHEIIPPDACLLLVATTSVQNALDGVEGGDDNDDLHNICCEARDKLNEIDKLTEQKSQNRVTIRPPFLKSSAENSRRLSNARE